MKPVSENDLFVDLIRIAEEDPAVCRKLCDILRHRPYQRASVLNYYIVQMQQTGAPEEFISAMACLLSDEVAEKASALLCLGENDPRGKRR